MEMAVASACGTVPSIRMRSWIRSIRVPTVAMSSAQRCPVCVNVIAGVADLPLRRAAAPRRAEQLDRRVVGSLACERRGSDLGVPDGFLTRRPVEEEGCSLLVTALRELSGLVRESARQHALLQHVLVDERRQGGCQ